MSRSRPPKCGTGRGCWCCGDAGAIRRRREAQGLDAIPAGLAAHEVDRYDESGEWAWDPIWEVLT